MCVYVCVCGVSVSPREAYEPGGRAEAELKGPAGGTAGILVLALALAAALTSTSLRERCREPGVEAGTLPGAALAGGRRGRGRDRDRGRDRERRGRERGEGGRERKDEIVAA